MIICIMALGLDSGLVALTVSVCLIAAGVIDEKTAFHSVPWNTIMVTGVGATTEYGYNIRRNRDID